MTPSLTTAACLEKRLLASCARTEVAPDIANQILQFVSQPLDWDYLLSQAQEHSVVSLVERNLFRAAPEAVPEACAAKLKTMARANAMRCLAMSAELIRVLDALESRGITAFPFKGSVIAAQAYGDIAARQFEDLDIVLRQCDIEAAHDAVRSLGYEAKFPWLHSARATRQFVPGEYNYFHPAYEAILELHTELTLRHFPVAPDLVKLFERGVNVEFGGRRIRTFCPEDALLMLCVHGAKDFWVKLIWIADVEQLLRSFPTLNWQRVQRTAEGLRAQRMLHLGLALAAEIFGAEAPAQIPGAVAAGRGASAAEVLDGAVSPEISAAVAADRVATTVARGIAGRLLSRDSRDFTAAQRFHFRRQMVRGSVAGWRYAMRLTLAPAEEDWKDSPAPGAFTPLRAALRPFRLLRKYGLSGR